MILINIFGHLKMNKKRFGMESKIEKNKKIRLVNIECFNHQLTNTESIDLDDVVIQATNTDHSSRLYHKSTNKLGRIYVSSAHKKGRRNTVRILPF